MASYISQILFGCKYEQCETPTCLTCRNRRANEAAEPFRKPTELTARILAHCLAGQTNPQEGLCPNGLRVNPENLQVQRHQGQKDKRSLSQNLFDTASIIDSLNHVPTSHMDDPSSVHHRAVGENDSLFNLTIASLRCQVLEAWNSKLRQSHDPVCAPQPSIGKSGDSSCPTCKSIFLSLSDTGKICRFFETDFNNLNIVKLNTSFRDLELLTDSLVYDALWVALGPVFTPPAELAEANRSRAYLDDAEAAHLVIVCIHALASSQHRHSPWLRLATRLVEAISARLRFEHKARYCASLVGSISFLQEVLSYLARVDNESQGSSRPSVYADWLRAVIHSYWDGRAELSIWSAVGVAFQLAEVICKSRYVLFYALISTDTK